MTPGRTLGGCRLVRELGRGGVGVVWEAIDEASGERVALKLLHQVEPRVLQRLAAEATALTRLRHPNAAVIRRAGEDQGRPFLVLRLVEGGSLRERIQRNGPLEQREAALMAGKLARALAHAHELGVLHRDLKPGNVLMDGSGEPILCDFGLARVVHGPSGLTRSGEMLGTPAYMSPEQAEGERGRIDERSDVWGLGAILYEMLAGRPPFGGPTILNQINAVMNERPAAPSSLRLLPLDPALEAVCLRCLEKDPAARFPSANAVGDALAAWLESSRRTRSRAQGWLLPAAVLGLGAAAAVGLVIARRIETSSHPPAATGPATSPSIAPPATPHSQEPVAPIDPLAAIRADLAAFRPDAALVGIERASGPEGPTAELRFLLARARYLKGEFDEAEELARTVESDLGLSGDLRCDAALLLGELGDATSWERARAIAPRRPEAWAREGLSRLYGGDLEGARRLLARARELAPGDPEVLRNCSQVPFEEGKQKQGQAQDPARLTQAEGLLNDCLRANEKDAEAWDLLAWVYRGWRQERVFPSFRRSWELREAEEVLEAATHLARLAEATMAPLEHEWDEGTFVRANDLLERALIANSRHPLALEAQSRLLRHFIARIREEQRPAHVSRALGGLGWALQVNPCHLGAAREIHRLLELGPPLLPDEQTGRRPRYVLQWLELGAGLYFPEDPDVIKARAALRLALRNESFPASGLIDQLGRLRNDEQAQRLLERIKKP